MSVNSGIPVIQVLAWASSDYPSTLGEEYADALSMYL